MECPPAHEQITAMLANVCYATWEINRNAKTKRTRPVDWIPVYRQDTQQEKADKAKNKSKIQPAALAAWIRRALKALRMSKGVSV